MHLLLELLLELLMELLLEELLDRAGGAAASAAAPRMYYVHLKYRGGTKLHVHDKSHTIAALAAAPAADAWIHGCIFLLVEIHTAAAPAADPWIPISYYATSLFLK